MAGPAGAGGRRRGPDIARAACLARAGCWPACGRGAGGLVFGGIVALALVTHLAWLNDIPWRFHYDELIAYNEAMRFYQGPPISLFTTTWWNTSLPSLFFPFSAGLMRFAGTGLG